MSASPASLASLLSPASIAVVGASPDGTRIRGALLHMLRRNGYGGGIYAVNPSYREIAGVPCFPSIAEIGAPVDLALIAVPAAAVPAVLEDCADAGVRHAVVISSGFAEGDGADRALEERVAAIARRTPLRILGPNSEGFHNELARVTATFSPALEPKEGEEPLSATPRRIAVVAQSGGIGFSFLNRGRALGLAFSSLVSTGNEADLTAANFLAHFAADSESDVILLFLECVRDAERFLAAARAAAAAAKPVVMIKIGRTRAGARAAASHTASMAGWSAAYDAAAKSTGMIQAGDPDEALALAALLAASPLPEGNRVAVVTTSGGAGAWMADALAARGLELPELGAETQRALAALMPSYGSARNPVDITAQVALSGGLTHAIELLCGSDEIDAIVVTTSLARENRVIVDLEALRTLVKPQGKPVLFYSYTLPSALARRSFAACGIVIHTGLAALAGALAAALWRRNYRPPVPAAPRPEAARRDELRRHLEGPGRTFCEYEAKRVLAAYGFVLPTERLVADMEELESAAAVFGYPLALKAQSPELPHKSEAGGVRLGIADGPALHAAYGAILGAVERHLPGLRLHGVLVAEMARPGIEMIVGAMRDAVFGPVVMVGAGGVMAELFEDASYRLAPVDEATAMEMLDELKSRQLLDGFRGAPAADKEALAAVIARLSDFAVDYGDLVREVEINPLVVHSVGEGCTIVDALLVTEPVGKRPSRAGSH